MITKPRTKLIKKPRTETKPGAMRISVVVVWVVRRREEFGHRSRGFFDEIEGVAA